MPAIALLLLLLAGCAQTVVTTQQVLPPIPDVVEHCPPAAPDPSHPPALLTVERLRLFAQEADAARIHDKAALRECAMRLRQAVEVINAARVNQGAQP
jgi:hypothetical protein